MEKLVEDRKESIQNPNTPKKTFGIRIDKGRERNYQINTIIAQK